MSWGQSSIYLSEAYTRKCWMMMRFLQNIDIKLAIQIARSQYHVMEKNIGYIYALKTIQ